MKYGLKETTIEQICSVFSSFPEIQKVVLYGSRAKGNFKNGSDIDLTFYGNNLDLKTLNKIEDQLEDLSLPYQFDLSIFDQISNKDLAEHIKRVGIIIYQNP